MSMMMVPSLSPGERSLPSELRTRRGSGFAHRRLMNGMRGVGGVGDGDTDTGVFTSAPELPVDMPVDMTPIDTVLPAGFVGPLAPGETVAAYEGPTIQAPVYSAPVGVVTSVPAGQTPPQAPAGYQWVQAANGAAQSLAKVLAISQGGTVMQLPNGQQIIAGFPGANVGVLGAGGVVGQVSAYLPYLMLAGGAVLLMSFMGGRGRG